jgi:hydrogenase maturation protease
VARSTEKCEFRNPKTEDSDFWLRVLGLDAMLVIGIGNPYRGDDAVGLVVAQRVRERALSGVTVLECLGEGTTLMEAWNGADAVIVVDAVKAHTAPGSIYRLDARQKPIPADFFHYSTHAFSVAEAIELARALDQLPRWLVVYGIEGRDFGAGGEMSSEVAGAAQEVAERILKDIDTFSAAADSRRA